MTVNRRLFLSLSVGAVFLPLTSCHEDNSEETKFSKIMDAIESDKLFGFNILQQLYLKNKTKILNIKALKQERLSPLIEKLNKWQNNNDSVTYNKKIANRIRNDFKKNRVIKIRKILFSKTEVGIFLIYNNLIQIEH